MKKFFFFMMLSTSIMAGLHAQDNKTGTEKTFNLTNDFHRKFIIDLEKGNKLFIEIDDMKDLPLISNMDSIIRSLVADIDLLKDSLQDEYTSKVLEFVNDTTGARKLRFNQTKPAGTTYYIDKKDISALKLEQDTIRLTAKVNFLAKYTLRKGFMSSRYYRLTFVLNRYTDLEKYATSAINKKIAALKNVSGNQWVFSKQGEYKLKSEPSISATQPQGYAAGDYLNLRGTVEIQNYKNYFVPSFSLGGAITISNGFFKREIGLFWEPNFLFERNAQGKLVTSRNDFLTLTWAQGPIKDKDVHKQSEWLFIASFSYLSRRKSETYDKNTFRFSGGRVSLFNGKSAIEPAIYFHDFFKGVTPGLRWVQSF